MVTVIIKNKNLDIILIAFDFHPHYDTLLMKITKMELLFQKLLQFVFIYFFNQLNEQLFIYILKQFEELSFIQRIKLVALSRNLFHQENKQNHLSHQLSNQQTFNNCYWIFLFGCIKILVLSIITEYGFLLFNLILGTN
ncbi:unnamed protein product [Paramecium sonneborni]|uniref:Transmembrane protein n=1 Tax=Paramecium sonneborni TaxID=65129 RepID=A0A8S1RCH8_9CILI|nr:unnamed protein product [Paramecium sonneborni]